MSNGWRNKRPLPHRKAAKNHMKNYNKANSGIGSKKPLTDLESHDEAPRRRRENLDKSVLVGLKQYGNNNSESCVKRRRKVAHSLAKPIDFLPPLRSAPEICAE